MTISNVTTHIELALIEMEFLAADALSDEKELAGDGVYFGHNSRIRAATAALAVTLELIESIQAREARGSDRHA